MSPHTDSPLAHNARGTGGLIGSYASPGANRLRDPVGPSSEASRTQCQLRSRAALREIGALNWSFPISSEQVMVPTRRGFTECFPTSGTGGWQQRMAHGSWLAPPVNVRPG